MASIQNLEVRTHERTELIDITSDVARAVAESDVRDGVCVVFVPHTTAGVTINENADPTVRSDMLMVINDIVPFDADYDHMEGNSAAHIKASMFGASETVMVREGRLVLGTWQGIYFAEFDGPRARTVMVKVMG